MIDRLTLRMYDMGIGDCLLIGFWEGQKPTYVLCDCGTQTKQKAHLAAVVQDVVDTCKTATGGVHVALIIGTHSHPDNICGFANEMWNEVEVDEVWLPKADDPIVATRRPAPSSPKAGAKSKNPNVASAQSATGRNRLLLGEATDQTALDVLNHGFKNVVARKYLCAQKSGHMTLTLDRLEGVKFHILSPKNSTRARLASFTQHSPGEAVEDHALRAGACDTRWRVDGVVYRAENSTLTFSKEEQKKVDVLADEPEGDLAIVAEHRANDESLVVAIEIGDQLVVLPGDAQWTAWADIMHNPDMRALLTRTSVLKLSHNGSLTGTPKALIDGLARRDVVALMSTAESADWPNIPSQALTEMLSQRCKVVRSDKARSSSGIRRLKHSVELELPIGHARY